MSIKEVIANLNHIYGFVAPDIQRSLDLAIKALEMQQRMIVSITGMNMPKCCADCELIYDYMRCSVTGERADFEKMDCERLPNCPLKEVRYANNDKNTV